MGEEAVLGVFQKAAVGASLSLGVDTVPLSMRIFIAEVVFRFLYVSYEKSGRKASCTMFVS